MNIGIDIDDTINNLHDLLIEKGTEFNKKEKINFKINSNQWDWDKAFGWNNEVAKKFLDENIENIYLNAEIKEKAEEVINRLHTEGNKIIIITARGNEYGKSDIYQVSEKWLKEKKITFDKLIINARDKAKICIENKIDVFIDDNVDYCKQVYKNGARVFMFNSPYNQEETECKRVYNWDEIYKEIKK